jgi:hypothetical protein
MFLKFFGNALNINLPSVKHCAKKDLNMSVSPLILTFTTPIKKDLLSFFLSELFVYVVLPKYKLKLRIDQGV